ncbi:sec1 family domain-containing protein, putative, partial [Eimeria maxima]
ELIESLPPKAFSDMFGSAATSLSRPLLILIDRDFDLLTMLQHTWLYGALIHDLLELRRDVFWRDHAFSPFPVAAAAVSQMLTEYNAELAKVGGRPQDAFSQPEGDISSDILKAVDVLPDLADKKRSLDAHTTIATSLVSSIKDRELDR